ncbi:unnamed protein product [Amoebophrya sp. A120]|nr:unnamed protein product [Amoebophrya sp. A120]|eukprot:GSA120T00022977001.1
MDFAPPQPHLERVANEGITIIPFRPCDLLVHWGQLLFEFVALPPGASFFKKNEKSYDRARPPDEGDDSKARRELLIQMKGACFPYGARWYQWFWRKMRLENVKLLIADVLHTWNPAHVLHIRSESDDIPVVLWGGNVKDGLKHLEDYNRAAKNSGWQKDPHGIAYRILRSPRLINHFLPVVDQLPQDGETRPRSAEMVMEKGNSNKTISARNALGTCAGANGVYCRQEHLQTLNPAAGTQELSSGPSSTPAGEPQAWDTASSTPTSSTFLDWPARPAPDADAIAKRFTVRDARSAQPISAPFALVTEQPVEAEVEDHAALDPKRKIVSPLLREMENLMRESAFDALVYVSWGTQSTIEFTDTGLRYLFDEFTKLPRVLFCMVVREVVYARLLSDVPTSLPSNVRLIPGQAPQAELFRHFGRWRKKYSDKNLLHSGANNIKFAFLSHCGTGGLSEAVGFSVPTLCVPFMNDQPANCELLDTYNLGRCAAHFAVALITASHKDGLAEESFSCEVANPLSTGGARESGQMPPPNISPPVHVDSEGSGSYVASGERENLCGDVDTIHEKTHTDGFGYGGQSETRSGSALPYVSFLGMPSAELLHPTVAEELKALWDYNLSENLRPVLPRLRPRKGKQEILLTRSAADQEPHVGICCWKNTTTTTLGTNPVLGTNNATSTSSLWVTTFFDNPRIGCAGGVLATELMNLLNDETYESIVAALHENAEVLARKTLNRNTEVGPLLEHFLHVAEEQKIVEREQKELWKMMLALSTNEDDEHAFDPD